MTDEFWVATLSTFGVLEQLSYYDVLGVGQNADATTIREAFYRRARELHPDRHAREQDPDRKRAVVALYARLTEAQGVLQNAEQRRAYDVVLAKGELRLTAVFKEPPASSADPKNPQAKRFYDLAVQRLRAKDLKGALLQLRLAVQLEPESPAIRAALEQCGDKTPTPTPVPVPVAAAPAPAATAAAAAPASSPPVREHERKPYAKPIKASCATWGQFVTLHAKNLSRGGLFVRTSAALDVGTRLQVRIGLPDGRTLEIESEVARVVATERGNDVPGVGLRFVAMSDEKKAQVEALLREARSAQEREEAAKSTPPVAAVVAPVAAPEPEPAQAAEAPAELDPAEAAILDELLAELARMREARAQVVLGVPDDADPSVVRKAFLRLSKKYHPDVFARYQAPLVLDAVNEAFVMVHRAYQRLRGPEAKPSKTPGAPLVKPVAQAQAAASVSSAPAPQPAAAPPPPPPIPAPVPVAAVPMPPPSLAAAAGTPAPRPLPPPPELNPFDALGDEEDEVPFEPMPSRISQAYAAAVVAHTPARPAPTLDLGQPPPYEEFFAEPDHQSSGDAVPEPLPSAPSSRRATTARPLLESDLFSGPHDAPLADEPIEQLSDMEAAAEGRAALKAGDYPRARALLAIAVAGESRDRYLRAAYHLAAAMEAKLIGRAEEARRHFETVLIFDKYCEEAIRELRVQPEGPMRGEKINVFTRMLFGKKDPKADK